MACTVSYGLLISRNRDSADSDRWRDNETLLPNSLRSIMHLEPVNNSRMVFGVYISMHRSVSASKPQFDCGTLLNRSSDCNNLLYNGLGSLREPTKTSHYLIRASFYAFDFWFTLRRFECSWHYSFCLQRSQLGSGNSGIKCKMFLSIDNAHVGLVTCDLF